MIEKKATIYDFQRMCDHVDYCVNCPMMVFGDSRNICREALSLHTDEANEIILKWCKEHPNRATRQDKFLEMFPNTRICCEAIDICPNVVGYRVNNCGGKDCIECKRKYWLEEIEE